MARGDLGTTSRVTDRQLDREIFKEFRDMRERKGAEARGWFPRESTRERWGAPDP